MAATPRLTYFRGRGRAETTRWLLAAMDIDFESVALETGDQLNELRASGKLLFNQIPLLEMDGLCLTQSIALVQYLARKGSLYGDSPKEAAKCDMVHGVCRDFAGPPMARCFKSDSSAAVQDMQNCLNKFGPFLESLIGEGGFTVGSRLSFADVLLAEALTSYMECIEGALDLYPKLKGLQARVVSLPGVRRYLSSKKRWPLPGDEYVINVARVLQRALPPHFPDKDRFVPVVYSDVQLYVGNLPTTYEKAQLEADFGKFGELSDHFVSYRSKRHRGFGFVTFASPDAAASAFKAMNGQPVETPENSGKCFRLEYARKRAEPKNFKRMPGRQGQKTGSPNVESANESKDSVPSQ